MTKMTCPGCGRAKQTKQKFCSSKCNRAWRKRYEHKRAAQLQALEDERTAPLQDEPLALSEPLKARATGRCPYCPKYIATGRSTIVAIPPTLPREGVFLDRDRGVFRDSSSGEPVPMHRRTWAHEKCQERQEKRWTDPQAPTREEPTL